MNSTFKLIFQLSYILLILVLKGIVFSILWRWFIAPMGLPVINFTNGFIIASIFFLFNHLPIWSFKDYKEEFRYNIAIGLKPLVILLFGYIIHIWPKFIDLF